MLIGLGTTLVHREMPHAQLARSLPIVVGKAYELHIGNKALNTAANL